jgi:hypothetical protein
MPGQFPNPDDPHGRHASTPAEMVRMNAAKRRRIPLLTWRDDHGELHIRELRSGETYSIGRRPTMAVVIGWDPKVSGLHAQLECVGGEWVISDDGLSKNGTLVNGELIRERSRLRNRDVIRVGTCLLAFHAAEAGEGHFTATHAQEAGDVIPKFDETQRLVLTELCRNYLVYGRPMAAQNQEIADALGYTVDMVKNRLRNMFKTCGIDHLPRNDKRAELIAYVVRNGIVSPTDYDDQPRNPK